MARSYRLVRNFSRRLKYPISNDQIRKIKFYLPPVNFISIHYIYIITTSLIASIIFWGSSSPSRSITYTDSLYTTVSSMTVTGLTTLDLNQLTTFQQILLGFLMMIGSTIFVTLGTVSIRKRAFEKRFRELPDQELIEEPGDMRDMQRSRTRHQTSLPSNRDLEAEKPIEHAGEQDDRRGGRESISRHYGPGMGFRSNDDANGMENYTGTSVTQNQDHIIQYAPSPSSQSKPRCRFLKFAGVGAHPYSTAYRPHIPNQLAHRQRGRTHNGSQSGTHGASQPSHFPTYLTKYTTGRNAQFHALSGAEREHLAGMEYRATVMLVYVVAVYFVAWQVFGAISLGAYMAHNNASLAADNGINPWWMGIFFGVSAFNSGGLSLLPTELIPFQNSIFTLIVVSVVTLAGNTAYPILLRLILWTMLKLLYLICPSDTQQSQHKATLRFLLRYPRRVYSILFPSRPSWWLLFMIICLTSIDWVAFELLNIGNPVVTRIPVGIRVLDGLFQAIAVPTSGQYVIDISSLRIGLQVLYAIMMYISAYPVVITMRHSNVYEERSLGLYGNDSSSSLDTNEDGYKFPTHPTTPNSTTDHGHRGTGLDFVYHQIRHQLAHDIWWIIAPIFLISCIEVSNYDRDPLTYSVFNIAFEVIAAYTVAGLTTGLPNQQYSFSGDWHTVSKLIMCAVMVRGRHRGLPTAIDPAVSLQGQRERLGAREEEDFRLRGRKLHLGKRRPSPGSAV
ncbi:uncharacterized protein BP5553_09933 [Venustampulla echinocandica]|uniref:Potassium transport protein n=1 Tax=Venustampulla echinocandica TaxID=2656787 RepID=A0A370TB40_9HELO|nr:uncharacterized protein BP5553_09933 [Venustampulla echinocandica]RDL31144.1 hypothetical protein BP5553_09933 [Venustampulla echinocandica]